MKYLGLAILGFYIFLIRKVYFNQEKEIFHPEKAPKNIYLNIKNYKKVYLKTSDNVTLEGIYLKNREYNPLIIYFGGNSNNAFGFLNIVKDLKNFNFLVFNYRGYANSNGKPSEKKILSDAIEIYDNYAKGKDVYLIGRSLGSSVATYLASKREVGGLVLITPFDSLLNLAKRNYPYLPISFILKHKFDTAEYVKYVRAPIAVINAENDELIPLENYLNLEKNIKNLAFKKSLKDTTHMAIFTHPVFLETLKEALNTIIKYNTIINR